MLPDAPHPGSKFSQVPKSCPESDQWTYCAVTAPPTHPQANGPRAARSPGSEASRPQTQPCSPTGQAGASTGLLSLAEALVSRGQQGLPWTSSWAQIRTSGSSLPCPALTGRLGSWETPGQVRARTQARHTPGSRYWKDQALCPRPRKWTDNR